MKMLLAISLLTLPTTTNKVPEVIIPHKQLQPIYIPPDVPILRAMSNIGLEELIDIWKTNRNNTAVMTWKFPRPQL